MDAEEWDMGMKRGVGKIELRWLGWHGGYEGWDGWRGRAEG